MPRERGAEAAGGGVDPRRLTYAPETADEFAPASRPTRSPEASIFPWEDLARIRGTPGPETAGADPSPTDHQTLTEPPPMNAASTPPARGDAVTALLSTPAVSPTAATFGWTVTAAGGQRPAREVPASGPGRRGAWKWAFWIALVAFAISQL